MAAPAVRLGEYRETTPGEFRVPDEDFYVAELSDWEAPVRSAYQDKATGEFPFRINLKFGIVADLQGDVEFADETVGGFFDLDLNPNAKGSILHVLRALDPTEEPEPGAALEPYRGKRCIVEVVHKVKASTKEPGKLLTFANVGSVKPMKKQKRAAAAEPETEPVSAPKRNPLLDDED